MEFNAISAAASLPEILISLALVSCVTNCATRARELAEIDALLNSSTRASPSERERARARLCA
eukprot:6186187-Pleurochrysis_carterae.AAC.1